MAVSRFHNLLRAKVEEKLVDIADSVCSGQLPDYPAYRDMVGYIRGLNDALRLCEDIERDLDS